MNFKRRERICSKESMRIRKGRRREIEKTMIDT
jgi:hypothetical protein